MRAKIIAQSLVQSNLFTLNSATSKCLIQISCFRKKSIQGNYLGVVLPSPCSYRPVQQSENLLLYWRKAILLV